MFERFTDRARRVVVLAQEEARILNHNYIGTEHILLGLIREGEGVAAQVLVRLGADLNRVRQQVIQLLHGGKGEAAEADLPPRSLSRGLSLSELHATLKAIADRLTAIERHLGITAPPAAAPDAPPAAASDDPPPAAASDDPPPAAASDDPPPAASDDK